MSEEVKLEVQAYKDREAIIIALTNSGYRVWVETKEGEFSWDNKFFVCIQTLTPQKGEKT